MEHDTVDTTLHILVAGRSPSWMERERWQAAMRGVRPLISWLMVILTAFFGYDAVITAIYGGQWQQILASLVLVLGAAIVVILFPIVENHRVRNLLQIEWYDEQADKYRLACGCIVALYGDRVARTDVRGEQSLYYSQITDCVESPDGFLINGGGIHILIRSQDLTGYDAQLIRRQLQERLEPSVFRIRGTAEACLTEPLPIPRLVNHDVVLSRASVTLRQPWLAAARRRRVNSLIRGCVVPAMVVFGVATSNLLLITGVYFLDLLIFCGGYVAAGVLSVKLMTAFGKKKTPLSLAFTRQGLACFAAGSSRFIPWERIRLTKDTKVVRLQFSDGNTLQVPLSSIEEPEAIAPLFNVR